MEHLLGPTIVDLLKQAAKAFKNGIDPFSEWWLSKFEVSADQYVSMSDIVGAVIEWYADQDPNVQAQILMGKTAERS